jgi:hypothetical protein
LRTLWQYDFPAGLDRCANLANNVQWSDMPKLPPRVCRGHEILRALWNSDRRGVARMARAQAGRGDLQRVQQQLSCRDEILRALRKAD